MAREQTPTVGGWMVAILLFLCHGVVVAIVTGIPVAMARTHTRAASIAHAVGFSGGGMLLLVLWIGQCMVYVTYYLLTMARIRFWKNVIFGKNTDF